MEPQNPPPPFGQTPSGDDAPPPPHGLRPSADATPPTAPPVLPPPTGAPRPNAPAAYAPPQHTPPQHLPPHPGAYYRPPVTTPPRRRRTGLILSLVGGGATLLIILVVVIGGAISNQAERQNALRAYATASDQLALAADAADLEIAAAREVLLLAGNPFLAGEIAPVEEAVAAAEIRVEDADAALRDDPERLETREIRTATGELRTLTTALDSVDLGRALGDIMMATGAASVEVDATYTEANNAPRIAFRDAAAELSVVDEQVYGAKLTAYVGAAADLVASHESEIAEKAGPLYDARMAAQAFARSFAPGVMLEFDWAPTVNGYGSGNSYGGYATWLTAGGGQANIQLSDSVARLWPNIGVQSLIVHEVGHAVLSRADCNNLFFQSEFYNGEEESWATAFAIGHGYTASGSGEDIYGRPSDGLIALSQQCR